MNTMNTMNTATIETPIAEETNLKEYFAYWKEITAKNAKLPASTFLLHDLILGRDPKKSAFTPITNKNKLANGQTRWQGLYWAIRNLEYKVKHTAELKKMFELSGKYPIEIATIANRITFKD